MKKEKNILLFILLLAYMFHSCSNDSISQIVSDNTTTVTGSEQVVKVEYEKGHITINPDNFSSALFGYMPYICRKTTYDNGKVTTDYSTPFDNFAFPLWFGYGDYAASTTQKSVSTGHYLSTSYQLPHFAPSFNNITCDTTWNTGAGALSYALGAWELFDSYLNSPTVVVFIPYIEDKNQRLDNYTTFFMDKVNPTEEQLLKIWEFAKANTRYITVKNLLDMFADGRTDAEAYAKLPNGWYKAMVMDEYEMIFHDDITPDKWISHHDGFTLQTNYMAIFDGQVFTFDEMVDTPKFDYTLTDYSDDEEKTVKVLTANMRMHYADYPCEFVVTAIDTLVHFKIDDNTQLRLNDGNRYLFPSGYGSNIMIKGMPENFEINHNCPWIGGEPYYDKNIEEWVLPVAPYDDFLYRDETHDSISTRYFTYRKGHVLITDKDTGKKQDLIIRQRPDNNFLSIDETQYNFGYDGGEFWLRGETTAPEEFLKITINSDWIVYDIPQTTTRSIKDFAFPYRIVVKENTSVEPREGEITVWINNVAEQNIKIRQEGRPSEARITRNTIQGDSTIWQRQFPQAKVYPLYILNMNKK